MGINRQTTSLLPKPLKEDFREWLAINNYEIRNTGSSYQLFQFRARLDGGEWTVAYNNDKPERPLSVSGSDHKAVGDFLNDR